MFHFPIEVGNKSIFGGDGLICVRVVYPFHYARLEGS